jgi:hypothetical protein
MTNATKPIALSLTPRTICHSFLESRSMLRRIGLLLLSLSINATLLPQSAAISPTPRIGILIHGFNTLAKGWDLTVWGDREQDMMGRIPQALAVLLMFQSLISSADSGNGNTAVEDGTKAAVALLLWGSGVPSIQAGKNEGRYTMDVMLERFKLLPYFSYFSKMSAVEMDKLEALVVGLSATEDNSTNTVTEIEMAFRRFERIGVNVIVRSATHAPRCLRDASKILENWKAEYNQDDNVPIADRSDCNSNRWSPLLFVSPAATCFEGCFAGDVVIAEPPHLPYSSSARSTLAGDRLVSTTDDAAICELQHMAQLGRNNLVSRILKVKTESLLSFNSDLEDLLKRYAT